MKRIKNFAKILDEVEYFRIASETAFELGVDAYIVGGFVRDILIDRESAEVDILVVGDGLIFAEKLAEKLNVKNIATYKNFGTAQFIYKNFKFEFVGARKESYADNSRNPNVENGTYEEDLLRRDFTINTLTISLNKNDFGNLFDKFGGLEDLKNKIIKTPLDPEQTFNDDPLRIMRAFRFASQLSFQLDDKVLKAAEAMRSRLKIVSQERITDEFLKILSSDKPSIGLELMYKTKALDEVFPEISKLSGVDQRRKYHHKDVFLHTCQVVDNISMYTDNLWLRFAALVHDIAKPATKKYVEGTGWTFHGHEEIGARMMKHVFRRMKLPHSKLEYIEKLIRLHLRPIALVDAAVTDSAIRRLIVNAGDDLEDLIILCRADITSKNPEKVRQYLKNYDSVMEKVRDVKERDHLRAFQSPVRGEEIMKVCGLKPSRKVGEIKSAIESAILDGEIPNTYEAAYEYLLKIKDKIIN